MKKYFLFLLWTMFMYMSVAGFAWFWVLEIDYPFWKLAVVALIQAFFAGTQFIIFGKKDKKGVPE